MMKSSVFTTGSTLTVSTIKKFLSTLASTPSSRSLMQSIDDLYTWATKVDIKDWSLIGLFQPEVAVVPDYVSKPVENLIDYDDNLADSLAVPHSYMSML